MAQIEEQVHHKFKVFVGELNADQTVGEMANEVAAFAEQNKVAAKSIGVEYLESAKRLIITLGYRDDEESYPIQLQSVHLGKIDAPGHDFTALEQKMAEAGGKLQNIICHELYVTESNDFVMVFMTHQNN
jgi:hypothetical protein